MTPAEIKLLLQSAVAVLNHHGCRTTAKNVASVVEVLEQQEARERTLVARGAEQMRNRIILDVAEHHGIAAVRTVRQSQPLSEEEVDEVVAAVEGNSELGGAQPSAELSSSRHQVKIDLDDPQTWPADEEECRFQDENGGVRLGRFSRGGNANASGFYVLATWDEHHRNYSRSSFTVLYSVVSWMPLPKWREGL